MHKVLKEKKDYLGVRDLVAHRVRKGLQGLPAHQAGHFWAWTPQWRS